MSQQCEYFLNGCFLPLFILSTWECLTKYICPHDTSRNRQVCQTSMVGQAILQIPEKKILGIIIHFPLVTQRHVAVIRKLRSPWSARKWDFFSLWAWDIILCTQVIISCAKDNHLAFATYYTLVHTRWQDIIVCAQEKKKDIFSGLQALCKKLML